MAVLSTDKKEKCLTAMPGIEPWTPKLLPHFFKLIISNLSVTTEQQIQRKSLSIPISLSTRNCVKRNLLGVFLTQFSSCFLSERHINILIGKLWAWPDGQLRNEKNESCQDKSYRYRVRHILPPYPAQKKKLAFGDGDGTDGSGWKCK